MRRAKTLVLAGVLCCPAFSAAQTPPPYDPNPIPALVQASADGTVNAAVAGTGPEMLPLPSPYPVPTDVDMNPVAYSATPQVVPMGTPVSEPNRLDPAIFAAPVNTAVAPNPVAVPSPAIAVTPASAAVPAQTPASEPGSVQPAYVPPPPANSRPNGNELQPMPPPGGSPPKPLAGNVGGATHYHSSAQAGPAPAGYGVSSPAQSSTPGQQPTVHNHYYVAATEPANQPKPMPAPANCPKADCPPSRREPCCSKCENCLSCLSSCSLCSLFPCHNSGGNGCNSGGNNGGECSGNVVTWVEALWHQPRRNDSFVRRRDASGTPIAFTAFDHDADHQFGYRVGAAYVTKTNLMYSMQYTFFDGEGADATFSSGGDPNIQFTFTGPGGLNGAQGTDLSYSWDLRYQTLDLMASAVLSPTECVDLIFGAGTRLADLQLRQQTDIADTNNGGFTGTESYRSDLIGLGPRLGVESRFYVRKNVAFYARGYTSLLWADRDERSTWTTTDVINGTQTFSGSYSRREIVPNLELATGVEMCLCGGRVLVGGGYELNYWFNLGDSQSVPNVPYRADVCLDGLYARVIFMW